ncbi:Hpt domain-containing protein [bacterium]|nr:Hpt domain-containing protein [bacterium]
MNNDPKKIKVVIDEDLEDMIPSYLQSCRDNMVIIVQCLKTNDYAHIRNIGHDLHGSGASFGFEFITEAGKQINQGAKNKDHKVITESITDLETYLNNLMIDYQSLE